MCRKGGPRCPETQGKKSRRRLNDRVNRVVEKSGMSREDWKQQNAALYDQMLKEAFGDAVMVDTTQEDTSWVNYRDTGTRVTSEPEDEPDEDAAFRARFMQEDDEDEDDKGTNDYSDMVSEDPADVNAFLNSQYGAGVDEAVAASDDEDDVYADDDPVYDYLREYQEAQARARQERLAHQNRGIPSWTPRTDNKDLLPPDAVIESPNPNPIFVYGTLRSGMGNYRSILDGKTTKERSGVRLPGATMYSNGGFPYVLEEDEGTGVSGDIMYLDYEELGDTLQNLDWLEGTGDDIDDDGNHYNRTLRYVQVGEKEYVQAWVYMPPNCDRYHVTQLSEVESGDWLERS